MKIPRDLSGEEFIRKLKLLGYEKTRQSGSHIRLTTTKNGEHHITIPNHKPLRIGTLSSVLSEIAIHPELPKEKLYEMIF